MNFVQTQLSRKDNREYFIFIVPQGIKIWVNITKSANTL